MKKGYSWFTAAALIAVMATPAFAEAEAVSKVSGTSIWFFMVVAISVVFGMTTAAISAGWAQSKAVKTAIEGIARNPAAAGKILPALLMGLAMIESLAIYVLVIALILLFSNPFLKFLG
ncbi:MAG: F0F1 ATP synthase subunit C [Deltaproteobacteria bacterium]|nr:F0F1 ATP synthase subunit C [Deltaproteobacteria bacterium]